MSVCLLLPATVTYKTFFPRTVCPESQAREDLLSDFNLFPSSSSTTRRRHECPADVCLGYAVVLVVQ